MALPFLENRISIASRRFYIHDAETLEAGGMSRKRECRKKSGAFDRVFKG